MEMCRDIQSNSSRPSRILEIGGVSNDFIPLHDACKSDKHLILDIPSLHGALYNEILYLYFFRVHNL